jgi:ABC-type antimicrobial peptide transport system permease subunit
MHKSIGDTIEYTDGSGDTFKVRIVGTIATSILQGNLLIAKDRFKRLYPREQGSRMFLIHVPPASGQRRSDDVAAVLSRSMSDIGLALTPTDQRLADFTAVQNTYLTIFQMLGALGLLLGTVGLGIVVVRNALERRKEFAVLQVLGLRRSSIRRMVLTEHALLLTLGLSLGALAALIAVIPSLVSASQRFPAGFTALMLGLIALSGLFWIWLATRLALAGSTFKALSEE